MSHMAIIDEYTKSATKIQTAYRGHAVRQENKKEIEEAKGKAKVLETYRTDKYMIDQF